MRFAVQDSTIEDLLGPGEQLSDATAQKTPWNRPEMNPFPTPAELFSGSDTEEESDAEVEATITGASERRAGRPKQHQHQPSHRRAITPPAPPQLQTQTHAPQEQHHSPTRPLQPQTASPWPQPTPSVREDPGSSGTIFQAFFGYRLGIFGFFGAFINSYAPRWAAGKRPDGKVPPKKSLYKTKSITKAEASKQVRQDRVARNKSILERQRSKVPGSPEPPSLPRATETPAEAKLKRQDSALRRLAGRDDARHTERVAGRTSYIHVAPPRMTSRKSQSRSSSTYRPPSTSSSGCSTRSSLHSDDDRTDLDDPMDGASAMDGASESGSSPPTPATPMTPQSPWSRPTPNTYEPKPSFPARHVLSSNAARASPRRESSGRPSFGTSSSNSSSTPTPTPTPTPPSASPYADREEANTSPHKRRRNQHPSSDYGFPHTHGSSPMPQRTSHRTRAFGAPPPLFTGNVYSSPLSSPPPRRQQRSFTFDASHGAAYKRFPRPGQDPMYSYPSSNPDTPNYAYASSSSSTYTSSSGSAYTYSSSSSHASSSTASSGKPRAPPKVGLRPTLTPTTMHLSPYERYETLWKRIARPPTSGAPLFTLKSFPWPGDRTNLTPDTLARFFGSDASGSRSKIKGQLVRWHPDKFRASGAVQRWVEPAEWESVCEVQEKVVVALTELLRRGEGQ